MVITNGDLNRSMLGPSEYNPPLVVDPDRVATRQIPLQGFESVPGRDGKILKNPCPVHLNQFAQCYASDRCETTIGFSLKKLLGVLVCEGLDHGLGLGMLENSRAISAARGRRSFTRSSMTNKE
jgi:hypothetical protein